MYDLPVFKQIGQVIGFLLSVIYSVIPNLGVAIILLTIGIFLLLYPLTAKQTRSMLAMQAVQPEIKKLQAKYKNDRQKLNEETMKFYQENKINPLSGCLPLVAQMPILLSLFGVLRNAQNFIPKSSELYTKFCDGFGVLKPDGTWSKCGVPATLRLIHKYHPADVQKGDPLLHHQHFLGLDLQQSAVKAHDGFMSALPYFILVALVIISYVVSTRQSQKRTPAANKQMGTVMKILPPFFGLISITLPSGVVLYLFTSSVFRVVQQGVIFNRHGHILTSRAKPAVDVKSEERPPPAAPTAPAVRERRPARPRPPQPAIERSPARAPASGALPGDDEKPRGFRGLFQLPPPPAPNGGNGAEQAISSDGGASNGGSPAPDRAAANRRRRNKKRKR